MRALKGERIGEEEEERRAMAMAAAGAEEVRRRRLLYHRCQPPLASVDVFYPTW